MERNYEIKNIINYMYIFDNVSISECRNSKYRKK